MATTGHGKFTNYNTIDNTNLNYINNNNTKNNYNNINNTIITLFNISTKNINTLLTTTLKLLHNVNSYNIPQNIPQATTNTPQASMGSLLPPPKGITWRTIYRRTSRVHIPSTSKYYLDPSPFFHNNKKKENKNIPPSSNSQTPHNCPTACVSGVLPYEHRVGTAPCSKLLI